MSLLYAKSPAVDPLLPPLNAPEELPSASRTGPMTQVDRLAAAEDVVHQQLTIISPPAFFRDKSLVKSNESVRITDVLSEVSSIDAKLPLWMSLPLIWGVSETPKEHPSAIPIEYVLLACQSVGHYDFYLETALRCILRKITQERLKENHPHELKEILKRFVTDKPAYSEIFSFHFFHSELKAFKSNKWTQERYNAILTELILGPSNQIEQVLKRIEADVLLLQRANHRPSLSKLEQLLIGLLGSQHSIAREYAVRLLNVIYDGHDWQVFFFRDILN
jgi:hypothetical protein